MAATLLGDRGAMLRSLVEAARHDAAGRADELALAMLASQFDSGARTADDAGARRRGWSQ